MDASVYEGLDRIIHHRLVINTDVSVSPADTTTYVLTATGPYGRGTAKVTVKVQ